MIKAGLGFAQSCGPIRIGAATELADDLSYALMLALERLTPAERAAFLLRDVFGQGFAEISAVLDRTEAACRQLASRARKAVRLSRSVARPSPETHRRILAAFGTAVASGDVDALAQLLRKDAVFLSDGGGKALSARNPIHGADRIARFYVGAARKFGSVMHGFYAEFRDVNGEPGIVIRTAEGIDQVLTIESDGIGITAIYVVRNPEKLRALAV